MSTVSESSVPKLRFGVFDSVYRRLYTTLTITFMLNPKLALQIIALWIWMEKSGFIDTVEKIHNLPLDLISGFADEAVLCIGFFKNSLFPTPSELFNSIPLLHFLMKKELPIMFLRENRASALSGMKKVFNDVCMDLEALYSEAKIIHETYKQKLAEQEMAQITRSFNANVRLDDATLDGNLSPRSSGLSGSGRIGFGLGSSSLQRVSSSSEQGAFNVGLSSYWNSGPSQVSSPPRNAANFRPDPIKAVLPGSPVSPHSYVGMGRSLASNRGLGGSCLDNRVLDASIRVTVRPKPDVGVIGQPPLARSNSFHYESTPIMTRGPNLSSPGHMIVNPAMRVDPSALIPQVYTQQLCVNPDTFVPAEQRTLFVTFSKGYRVHEAELRNHITDCLGDCIESVQMQDTPSGEQPLYARIVFYYPKTIDAILNGRERYKFIVNGKHVCVRKYVPKNQRNIPNL